MQDDFCCRFFSEKTTDMSVLDLIRYFSVNFLFVLEKYQFTGNEPSSGNLSGLTDHTAQA